MKVLMQNYMLIKSKHNCSQSYSSCLFRNANTMFRRNQSISLFQPIDSASRLKRIQASLKRLSIPALVLIAGLDGNHHVGTVRILHYLLLGFCGNDLRNEASSSQKSRGAKSHTSENEQSSEQGRLDESRQTSSSSRDSQYTPLDVDNLPTGILHNSDLDEIFMVIKQNSTIIYCLPHNSKFITNITSMWPNTEYLKPSLHDYQNDMDRVESYKISQFLRVVNEIPQKVVAFPLTPTISHPNGDPMEIEQWSLVQAYGLSNFEHGGFFTMKFQVEGIMLHLESLFSIIDSQTVKILSTCHLETLKNQWDNVTANFDAYMSNNIEDLDALREISEGEFIEPLTSAYAFSSIRPMTPKESLKQGRATYPRLLLGNRSCLEDALSGNHSIASQEKEEGGPISHFILDGSDSQSPLMCSRSYFLQMTSLPTDSLLSKVQKSVSTTKIINSYNPKQTTILIDIYFALLENFEHCCDFISSSTPESWKDLEVVSKEFLSRFISRDNISNETKEILSEVNPLVYHQVLDMSSYVHNSKIQKEVSLQSLECGVFYLKIEYPFIKIDTRNLGSLIFGETLALSKSHTSSVFTNQVVSLTQDIPSFTCFKADKAECMRSSEIIEAIEQRVSKNKLPHPKMHRYLTTIDNLTLVFPNSRFYRLQGEASFYTHGFSFVNPRYGIFTLSWDQVKEIILHQYEEGDAHFIELKTNFQFIPFGPLRYFQNQSVIIHFFAASRIRRLFVTHVLSEWKTSCSKTKIIFKELREVQKSREDKESVVSDGLDKVIQYLDLESECLKQRSKNTTKDTLHFFSLSSQTSSEVPILIALPEYNNLLQSIQFHDSGLGKKDISVDLEQRGTKSIPIHIITGGVRVSMIYIATNLISMAKSEYNLLLVPIGGKAALDPHEEPEYDFKIFISQLIQAIKEGRTAESIDNVHLLYIVPGFTDVERVVRGIQQLKQAKNIPINISSVNACVDKNLLLVNQQVDTDVLPHILRQCTNGFVMNIFLNQLASESEREIELLLRRASPCAYISYISYSQHLPLYDAKEILKGNRFNSSRFVKARTLSSKNVGSDIRATMVKCRPITFDYDQLLSHLNDEEVIKSKSFYFSGVACVMQNDEQKLFTIIGFPSKVQLITIGKPYDSSIPRKVNRFYFYGKRINEETLQEFLEEAFVPFPKPKPLLQRPTLSYEEIENIREHYLLEDLPEGWNFDGSMFIDPEGNRVKNHPYHEDFIRLYIEKSNKEIEAYNRSIPTTNITIVDCNV